MHARSFRIAFVTVLAGAGVALGTALLPAQKSVAPSVNLTVSSPEAVGFSADGLERLHAYMQQNVDSKQIAGAVTILARHGKVVDYRTYGSRDMAAGAPMTKETIFRDYSMTKPVTGVAMMILYEQGKWLPSDPIAKYVPEFAHLKVFAGMDAEGKPILVEPDHPPTMHELMSHTAGFTYGLFGDTPVDKMYRDADLFSSKNLQDLMERLAKLPLLFQPGKGWTYSMSMDIEGYIVEKLSGQTLPDFIKGHIFTPLGMTDADFYVPQDKRSRFAALYTTGKNGELALASADPAGKSADYLAEPSAPSGGGGMVSTGADYYRFADMLRRKGELDGKRIISPASVKLMTSNHLAKELLNGHWAIGNLVMRQGMGYGYNGGVEFDPPIADLPTGRDTYFWSGAAGTWFWVDPTNDVVFVGMIQRMLGPQSPPLEQESRAIVYGALVDPAK